MTTTQLPQSRRVQAHGVNLHYLDWGNETAPPVLLVHGLQDCAGLWDTFARSIRDRYHVMALDQRGHGDSDRATAETYRLSDYVQEIGEVIEALNLRNVILMGHSAGSKNSWIYATQHSERLAKLVIVDMDPDSFNPGSEDMRKHYREESDEYADLDAVIERLRTREPHASEEMLRQNAVAMTKVLPNGELTWRRDRIVVIAYDRPDAWDYLPKIKTPTLLVHGAISTLLTTPVADRMEQAIPGCKRVDIPSGGHWSHLEFPGVFEKAVTAFLNEG
jgi:pimeloyl-ACP methyl ester carboxylesterase